MELLQEYGEDTNMNFRLMANVCRILICGLGLTYSVGVTNAQLTNGGFEIGSGLYTNAAAMPADPTYVTTGAVGWVQFANGLRVSTNDAYAAAIVTNPVPPNVTARSGNYSLKCFGSSTWDGEGAYQVITNGVAAGQSWVASGYGLIWSGDPLYNQDPFGPIPFGLLRMEFKNSSGATLGGFNAPTIGTNNTPLDTWKAVAVTNTTPIGTVRIDIYVMELGFGLFNQGSVFFDDISLVNLTGGPVQTNLLYATISGGNQVCWPSTAGLSYQPQYTNSATGPVWTNLGGEVAGNGVTNCVFDSSPSAPNSFYRVLQLQ